VQTRPAWPSPDDAVEAEQGGAVQKGSLPSAGPCSEHEKTGSLLATGPAGEHSELFTQHNRQRYQEVSKKDSGRDLWSGE